MKTCLYNFDLLKPHFYIVKLGFIGVYIIFLISAQNIDCGYSLEPIYLDEAVLTSTHNLCFEQKYETFQSFLSENFHFLVVNFSVYLNRRVFVMDNRNGKNIITSRWHFVLLNVYVSDTFPLFQWIWASPASILRKSTSGRHRPVSYPDGPMTARYRFT